MTIPSRPAPPPPQPNRSVGAAAPNLIVKLPPPPASVSPHLNGRDRIPNSKPGAITRRFPSARTRYAPVTNWEDKPFGAESVNNNIIYKKVPPPRPPPPKVLPSNGSNYESSVLKKPGAPPQSVNVLSNIFGKKKPNIAKKPSQKLPPFNLNVATNNQFNQFPTSSSSYQSQNDKDFQLITFDSPPSSPTFTQKSNSDCVSVDSFSSDSNFSSPHNGSISQNESGFEDDFTSPVDPFEGIQKESHYESAKNIFSDATISQPIRNMSAINRIPNDNPLCNGKTLLPPPPALNAPTIIKPKNLLASTNSTPTKTRKDFAPSPVTNDILESDFVLDDTFPPIPMPTCPPPPPPPEVVNDLTLDAIEPEEDVNYDEPSYGIALYDFEGVEDGDLSLRVNEKVYLLEQLNDEWLKGRNRSGCEGIFPRNYIQIKIPLRDATVSETNTKVRILYNFDAETPEDLSLRENQYVNVLHKINDDWLYGEIDGKRGQFPSNFIEFIPKNLKLASN